MLVLELKIIFEKMAINQKCCQKDFCSQQKKYFTFGFNSYIEDFQGRIQKGQDTTSDCRKLAIKINV